jgi:Holliday junction resolvasome RuvABC endonuclease subunit
VQGESPVIGIDLSLTGTALAWKEAGKVHMETMHNAGKLHGRARRQAIYSGVYGACASHPEVCIEGLAFTRNMPSAQERAALWFRVVDELEDSGVRVIVVVPTALKKFVCGKGNAEKSMMIREVYRRWGFEASNDNEADAAGLLMIGLAVIGENADLTTPQREVVASILTPKVKKAKKAA